MKNTNKQKGSSLYITILYLSIILTVAVGVTNLMVSGSNLVKGMGDSVRAFHVADTAIEQVLYEVNQGKDNYCFPEDDFSATYMENVSCEITVNNDNNLTITTKGTYNGSSRFVEASIILE